MFVHVVILHMQCQKHMYAFILNGVVYISYSVSAHYISRMYAYVGFVIDCACV